LKNELKYPKLRHLVRSSFLDLFGSLLVLGVCIYRDFLGTIFYQGELQFGVELSELFGLVVQGAYPLGILSTFGAVLSLMSTRLVGKQKNIGNVINIFATINSGANDFLFGNASAIITYPLTFFITLFAVKKWTTNKELRKRDIWYYFYVCIGMFVAFGLVYLGAYLFGGRTDSKFLILVSLIFGLSLGANICNAYKYEETWLSWVVYNIVQLWKNVLQLNIANVVKYIFYLINAFITLFDWKGNGKNV